MNHVFFGLVALAMVFAVLNGTPAGGWGALDAAKEASSWPSGSWATSPSSWDYEGGGGSGRSGVHGLIRPVLVTFPTSRRSP